MTFRLAASVYRDAGMSPRNETILPMNRLFPDKPIPSARRVFFPTGKTPLGQLFFLITLFFGHTAPAHPPEYLQVWDGTIDQKQIAADLEKIYFPHQPTAANRRAGSESPFLELREEGLWIDYEEGPVILRYAETTPTTPARFWRNRDELPQPTSEQPLRGLRLNLDPGHIGGEWAKIEERWFQIGSDPPVVEGEINLLVSQMIATTARQLGAEVTFTRETNTPVTESRPEDFLEMAREWWIGRGIPEPSAEQIRKRAEWWFYRGAEIQARAELINHTLQPDMVLAIHFNGTDWPGGEVGRLAARNHFHVLIHGSYLPGELNPPEARKSMLHKLLTGTSREERGLGAAMVAAFVEQTDLPPFTYGGPNAVQVDGNPYLWARNLAANRTFHAPVVFLEPYVMNSIPDYPRLVAGDYDGWREIDGRQQRSIFREYHDAVIAALVNYYYLDRISP